MRWGYEMDKVKELELPNTPDNDTARRDALAMVCILDKMKGGFEPFEIIYDSLKSLHGKPFERHFRDGLTNRGASDGKKE